MGSGGVSQQVPLRGNQTLSIDGNKCPTRVGVVLMWWGGLCLCGGIWEASGPSSQSEAETILRESLKNKSKNRHSPPPPKKSLPGGPSGREVPTLPSRPACLPDPWTSPLHALCA